MKKTIISIAYSAALIIAIALTSTSCKREPLHEPFSNYYLVIEGDYKDLHIDPVVPSMYEAVFYDKDNHTEVGQSYLGPNGGYIYDLAPGTYEMIVYSFQTSNSKIFGLKSYQEAIASTERYMDGDTLSYDAPDHVMVARDGNFEIPLLFDRDEPEYLYAYPKSLAQSWGLIITGIKGLKNAVAIDVYITGQAATRTLASQELSKDVHTIHFPGQIDMVKDIIHTPFCTFGHIPGKHCTLRLVIEDPNQQKIICHADVTNQFEDPENTGRWIKANFDIEIEPKKDGGMQPTVHNWEENEYIYDLY